MDLGNIEVITAGPGGADPSRVVFNGMAIVSPDVWTMLVSESEYSWGGLPTRWWFIGTTTYAGTWERRPGGCHPVPEPATLSLLGIGLVGLIGGAARKKLKKKAIAKT